MKKNIIKTHISKLWIWRCIIATLVLLIVISSPILINKLSWLPDFLINPTFLALTSISTIIVAIPLWNILYAKIRKKNFDNTLLQAIAIFTLFLYAIASTFLPLIIGNQSPLQLYVVLSSVIVLVTGFYILNEYQHVSVRKALRLFKNQLPEKTIVVRNGSEIEIDISELKESDIIKLTKGNFIPADGIIIEGSTFVKETALTGENDEIEKTEGDQVMILSKIVGDPIMIKATQVGKNSLISQIKGILEEGEKKKALITINAEQNQQTIVFIALFLAIAASVMWFLIENDIYMSVMIFVTMLLIVNPKILGISGHLPYKIGKHQLVKQGVLFRSSRAIEIASKIKHVIFDKTGVLTHGIPEIDNIIPKEGFNENRLLILIGSLESFSSHPFAVAIANYVKERNLRFEKAYEINELEGLGIIGMVDAQEIIAGNKNLMEKSNVQMDDELLHKAEVLSKSVRSPIFIARNRKLIGLIGVSDIINPAARSAVTQLKKVGQKISLITGDNKRIAENIAEGLLIKNVIADVIKSEKAEAVKNMQDEGELIAAVGNGLKDKELLEQSDLGIAIGTGAETILHQSDLSILKDNLSKIKPALIKAVEIEDTAQRNMLLAFAYNALAIIIASGAFYPIVKLQMHPTIGIALSVFAYYYISKESSKISA